jgi:2-C-methyl-D-erythritol 4-phosphate cytidylyltransferase
VTEDAQAVELLPSPVYLVEHLASNAKITYPADLAD